MLANAILINTIFLIGAVSILGILIMVIKINGKINELNKKIIDDKKNQDHINWNINKSDSFFEYNDSDSNLFHNAVNIMTFKSEADSRVSVLKEEELIREKVKAFQEKKKKVDSQKSKESVGIVFCRNCATQFTSDEDSCPVCGMTRR